MNFLCFDDLVRIRQIGRFAQHDADAAVARLGQFDGALD